MTTATAEATTAKCKHCKMPIFQRMHAATGELVWDLVFVEYGVTTTCFGRDEEGDTFGHEPRTTEPQVIRFSDNTPRCTTCHRDGHKPRTWDGHWFTNDSDDADRARAAARAAQ